MPKNFSEHRKLGALLILGALCAWLVYRNLLHPGEPGVAAPLATAAEQRPGTAIPSSGGQRGQIRQGATASNLDPTLRLDLLEASRAVKYAGGSRNIFQLYTPPPPPATLPAPPPTGEQLPSAPAVPTIPLKFYGIAQPPGNQPKKAFLTDGEEIWIGHEGDVVSKFYKIIRIGVNTLELEDTRSRQRQQLPLLEE